MIHSFRSWFYGIAIILIAFIFYASTDSNEEKVGDVAITESPNLDGKGLPQIIKPILLDKTYSVAGEPLPADNFDVMERLDREFLVNSYWHSSTLLNLKAAKRYFPIMEQVLAREDVPEDFKYVAVIESNLRNVTSPAGAKGLWQFMPSVARGYGLELSREVDERYHLEKSTRAACALIKDYKKRFNTWTNAMGAYNMGETRFAKEQAIQKMDSYYDMNFGAETGRYLFRILAVKEIMEQPQDFGFYLEDLDPLYKPLTDCNMVKVDKTIANLGEFAKEHGTTYRMLKVYNPWLISSRLTVAPGKTYEIKIPI